MYSRYNHDIPEINSTSVQTEKNEMCYWLSDNNTQGIESFCVCASPVFAALGITSV